MEKLFITFISIVVVIAIFKVIIFRLVLCAKKIKPTKATKEDKQIRYLISCNQEEQFNSLYLQCRDLFKIKMQHADLNQEQIIYIKNYLRNSLANYKEFYAGKKYKNDAHEIYSLLKSPFLNNYNYIYIIDFLKE